MSANNPTCPANCQTDLPLAEFDTCSPETNYGQIKKMYVRNDGYPFSDWTDPVEWNTYVSNSSTDVDAIREFTIVGSKPKPESQEKKISGGRTVKGKKKHTMPFKIDETNTTNYDLLRTFECGLAYRIWFATDNYMYGGNDGILASITMDEVIPENEEDFVTFDGEAIWYSNFAPERTANPLAA